jgi:hypothetical protein
MLAGRCSLRRVLVRLCAMGMIIAVFRLAAGREREPDDGEE